MIVCDKCKREFVGEKIRPTSFLCNLCTGEVYDTSKYVDVKKALGEVISELDRAVNNAVPVAELRKVVMRVTARLRELKGK